MLKLELATTSKTIINVNIATIYCEHKGAIAIISTVNKIIRICDIKLWGVFMEKLGQLLRCHYMPNKLS